MLMTRCRNRRLTATAQLTQIMKPVTGAISGLTVVGLAAMFGLAIGYKRDKLAYNPETERHGLGRITGDVVKHGDRAGR